MKKVKTLRLLKGRQESEMEKLLYGAQRFSKGLVYDFMESLGSQNPLRLNKTQELFLTNVIVSEIKQGAKDKHHIKRHPHFCRD